MKLTAIASALPMYLGAEAEFALLSACAQREVHRVLDAAREACEQSGSVGAAVERFGAALGLHPKAARRRWDAIRHHGWQGALDGRRRRTARMDVARRPAFLAMWRELVDGHQRSCRAAWHDLIALWKSGRRMPGYDEFEGRPPVNPATGLPVGWSYRRLVALAPDTQERLLARIGPKAYTGRTTQLWTTRVGLHCGEVYQADDVWHDHAVWTGRQLVRPQELGYIDVFSTRRVLYGLTPRLRDEAGKQTGLKETWMVWLTAALLTERGFWPEGCTLIVEHGTAALSEPVERAIFEASAGKVRVDRSGIADKPAVLGWWAGEGGGNPRMKACLESLHNYTHNRLGALPVQVGSNSRTDKPERLAAIEKYAAGLARELGHFEPRQVEELLGLLRLPALTLAQFHGVLDQFYTLIDSRTEHAMEGWDRAGLVRTQWRLSPQTEEWHDAGELATLGEAQYAAVRALLDGDTRLMRPRRLSPLQVWEHGRQALRRLPPWTVPQILPEECAREVTVRGHRIEFADQTIDPDGVRYGGTAMDPQGRQIVLREGETYRAWVNPIAPTLAQLTDAHGRYIGAALRIERAPRADRAAVMQAIGSEARRQAERMAAYRERHAGDALAHQDMLAHNRQVLDIAAALRAGRDPAAERMDGDLLQTIPEIPESATDADTDALLSRAGHDAEPTPVPVDDDIFEAVTAPAASPAGEPDGGQRAELDELV